MKGGNFQMVLIREYYDVNFVLVDLLDKNENIMLAYVGVQWGLRVHLEAIATVELRNEGCLHRAAPVGQIQDCRPL